MKLSRKFAHGKSVLVNQSNSIIVCRWNAIPFVRAAHWQAYKAVKRVPTGKLPWSVDNRRIGPEHGFRRLRNLVNFLETA